MLDERTSAVLETINEICGGGGAHIAEEGELLSSVPGGDFGKEELARTLGYLEERRYIEIEYAEDGVYCIRPLPEGRLYSETVRRERRESKRRRTAVLLTSALGGFLGALAGSLLILLAALFGRGA